MNIFDLRRDFTLKTLDESDVLSNPIDQFQKWFAEALESEALEPNAMNLATVSSEGHPSSRIVLLKEIRPEGFVFFTNYESDKAVQLNGNPYCALNMTWHELERQVRIEGVAERISPKESDTYFEVRPIKSKLGAWASPQSRVISDRKYLEELMVDFEYQFEGQAIQRPENWGGYIVKPFYFEFWQGRSNRLHDRIRYRQENGIWIIERLAP